MLDLFSPIVDTIGAGDIGHYILGTLSVLGTVLGMGTVLRSRRRVRAYRKEAEEAVDTREHWRKEFAKKEGEFVTIVKKHDEMAKAKDAALMNKDLMGEEKGKVIASLTLTQSQKTALDEELQRYKSALSESRTAQSTANGKAAEFEKKLIDLNTSTNIENSRLHQQLREGADKVTVLERRLNCALDELSVARENLVKASKEIEATKVRDTDEIERQKKVFSNELSVARTNGETNLTTEKERAQKELSAIRAELRSTYDKSLADHVVAHDRLAATIRAEAAARAQSDERTIIALRKDITDLRTSYDAQIKRTLDDFKAESNAKSISLQKQTEIVTLLNSNKDAYTRELASRDRTISELREGRLNDEQAMLVLKKKLEETPKGVPLTDVEYQELTTLRASYTNLMNRQAAITAARRLKEVREKAAKNELGDTISSMLQMQQAFAEYTEACRVYNPSARPLELEKDLLG